MQLSGTPAVTPHCTMPLGRPSMKEYRSLCHQSDGCDSILIVGWVKVECLALLFVVRTEQTQP